jgi:hypothetical protein
VAHAKGGPRFPSAHARTLNSPSPLDLQQHRQRHQKKKKKLKSLRIF